MARFGLSGLSWLAPSILAGLLVSAGEARSEAPRVFEAGRPVLLEDLPPSRLRKELEALAPSARMRALATLSRTGFAADDGRYLRVDAGGGVFYEDPAVGTLLPPADQPPPVPERDTAPRQIRPIAPADVFRLHSKPGAPNVVFLNFQGERIVDTIWNSRPVHVMKPYSEDGNPAFSQAETNTIAEVWNRVSEDYAPFDIDVTTERPPAFGPTVGHVLISPRIDAAGVAIYPYNVGGVAYLNVWGSQYFTYRQPALVFPEGVPGAKNIAEAASHELGHNLGLVHDGQGLSSYYLGHGTGLISWAPIMGAGYYRNVTQWSKGEYLGATASQDDLGDIAFHLGWRPDDHGSTPATATPLSIVQGKVASLTPVTDPRGVGSKANQGIIGTSSDVDLFFFDVVTAGRIELTVTPDWVDAFLATAVSRSSNLDVAATLYRGTPTALGTVVASSNVATDTYARITANATPGRYYLRIEGSGAGDPRTTGYSRYASLGRYFIKGTVPFDGRSYPLTVTRSGPGTGTVTSEPAGIACPGDCAETVGSGTTVVLTATAAYGSNFAGWSGACSGKAPTCTVLADAAKSVGAAFEGFTPLYALSVAKAGPGSGTITSSPSGIACGAACTARYQANVPVTLTATPAAGSVLAGWTGACVGTTPTCTLRLLSPQTVSAIFAKSAGMLLTAARTGTGTGTVTSTPSGIDCGAICAVRFDPNTRVTLTAKPAAGSTFGGWSGACSGAAESCAVTLSAARTAAARFDLFPALTVEKSGVGSGRVTSSPAGLDCGDTCAARFAPGTVVTLTAVPDADWGFAGWSGPCSGFAPTCTVTLAAARTVRAAFDAKPNVEVVLSGGGRVQSTPAGIDCGGFGSCTATFRFGEAITLVATPNEGLFFDKWTGACTGSVKTCKFTLAESRWVVAYFGDLMNLAVSTTANGRVVSSPAGIDCEEAGPGCSHYFYPGTAVTLTASAKPGYHFTGWSGNCSGTQSTCSLVLSVNHYAAAAFAADPIVTARVDGTAEGRIVSLPAGVDCPLAGGTGCRTTVPVGQSVTFSAVPANGNTFVSWGDACASAVGDCTLTVTEDVTVSAQFRTSGPAASARAGLGAAALR